VITPKNRAKWLTTLGVWRGIRAGVDFDCDIPRMRMRLYKWAAYHKLWIRTKVEGDIIYFSVSKLRPTEPSDVPR